MTEIERRKAAKEFAQFWKGKGYEKGESQIFWINLLRDVYDVEKPHKFIVFEDQVHIDHTSFIDGYIAATHVLIEQKSLGKDLRKPIKQADGSLLTPFQQAKRYAAELPYSQRPRWIVTCNFGSFLVYDMEKPTGEPEEILLENLPNEYYRLNFLVNTKDDNIRKEMEISIQAGELVGRLYDAFLKRYIEPTSERTLKSLNMLCVRLVFCLYAEDAGIFGRHGMFHDYLRDKGDKNARRALIDLFRVLDTEVKDRDPYMDEDLAAFPYVNGGLFSDEDIEIPQINKEIYDLLLSHASEDFDWSAISPTIFGAVFESTLNPETRRKGGMHYTSIENIHKVIDPLFLDDLRKELEDIKAISVDRTRTSRLRTFQSKLAELVFLDPACGSGNFLTETYISLRRLENEVLRVLIDAQKGQTSGQIAIGLEEYNLIQVSIGQFYGIEINDFAVTVAKTALWIAESQMMKQTEDVVHMSLDFLPLKSYANIVEGNALRMGWASVVHKDELNYIMGNPPFVGYAWRTEEQHSDMDYVFKGETRGHMDYVAAWYKIASLFIRNTRICCAFVSTNSICQGEQVERLWKPLMERDGIRLDFAHRTFKWSSEAKEKAAVHCVILGFSFGGLKQNKVIFDGDRKTPAGSIHPYIIDAPLVFIEQTSKPRWDVPEMSMGNMPRDGGNLLLTQEERDALVVKEPSSEKWIRRFSMGDEFINNTPRYCLWLLHCPPNELKKMPSVLARVEKVRQMRLASKAESTRQKAATPYLFGQLCKVAEGTKYIAFPKVSSERRRYIPIGFLDTSCIPGDKLFVIPNATLFHFGVLMSNVHNAWMRVVGGRLKSDYSYSNTIVYNNFPWATTTDAQKSKIEKTAQAILDARALYPESSLADLYDDLVMPPELRKAHQQNDRAVMEAYGFWGKLNSESDCVAELMQLYAARANSSL